MRYPGSVRVEDLLRPPERPLGVDDPLGLAQPSERARPGRPIPEWRQRSIETQRVGVVRGLEVL